MYIHAYPEGSKVSRYDSLKQVEKSTGKTPPDLLNAPPLSPELEPTWDAYVSLPKHTYQEIQSYISLTGAILFPWEVRAIVKLAKYREVKPIWPLK